MVRDAELLVSSLPATRFRQQGIDSGAARSLRSFWPEWCALALYAALVACAIPYHEPWADEAQTWQLAHSLPLLSLFKTYIRYEVSPGLWPLLLWILIRLHITYAGLHWICGLIAAAGAALLLFKSPFPRWLKLPLPFTCFLLFQYAVVARNYVLAPPLMFLAAILWKKSPLRLALVLGLLANVALHTTMIASVLVLIYLIEQVRSAGVKTLLGQCKFVGAVAVFLAFLAFALYTAWPPHDLAFAPDRSLPTFLPRFLTALFWPVCYPQLLSLSFWVVIAVLFYARRNLLFLFPILLYALFCGVVYLVWWHAGLIAVLLIGMLWITWPPAAQPIQSGERYGRIAFAVMIAFQIGWSGYALYYDHYFAFAPDPATAAYLRPFVNEGAPIAVTYLKDYRAGSSQAFLSVGPEPFFDHNIYANTPYPFWWWSKKDRSDADFNALLPTHPRFVLVVSIKPGTIAQPDLDHPIYRTLANQGYQYRNTFCGSQPMGPQLGLTVCHVIYEYPIRPGAFK
ncbi:MAG TPA: hypothetical protein VME23_00395 [Terracidiphilus sp.]|nr:hypothetical protein [Terracidiphilus sp.]